jgi:hypothetical protein
VGRDDLQKRSMNDEDGGEMDDRPEDRTEDRRRRGPLGDEGDAEETRRVPRGGEDARTRRASPEDAEREGVTRTPAPENTSPRLSDEEDPETHVIRTPGTREDESASYPRGYIEADEAREARLREVYGGVDWLASFIGCIFAIVCSGILLLFFSGLVLNPLGFTLDLRGREMDAAVITGLVVVGLVLFVSYFFGGYVAGRLARFDGGLNGAATVLWGVLLSAILLVGSFLPGPLFRFLQEFVQNNVLPTIGGLTETGLVGAGIIVGVLLLELLGGFLGGRLGNLYHTRIDHTT